MLMKATGKAARLCLIAFGVLITCSIPADLRAEGETLVDSGFSFPNWGGDEHPSSELTPNDLVRLFGERVCVRWDGDDCVPTPGAMLWLEQQNAAMKGGHCEGMAALSRAFHVATENPSSKTSAQKRITPLSASTLKTLGTPSRLTRSKR